MQDIINKLNSLYTSYLCKEISCNVCNEIQRYQDALRPEIDELKSYLENSGYVVTLHSASSFFDGGPATTIAKIHSLERVISTLEHDANDFFSSINQLQVILSARGIA